MVFAFAGDSTTTSAFAITLPYLEPSTVCQLERIDHRRRDESFRAVPARTTAPTGAPGRARNRLQSHRDPTILQGSGRPGPGRGGRPLQDRLSLSTRRRGAEVPSPHRAHP